MMDKNIIALLYGTPYRFHQPLTSLSAIARIDIHVLTPETFWTVIGIAISLHQYTAISACKIFDVALEFFVHGLLLVSFTYAIRSKVRFRLGDTGAARSKFQWSRTNSLKITYYIHSHGKC